jgi:hypothetical protein
MDVAVIGTNCGCFGFTSCVPGRALRCIAAEGFGWEHVSVSVLRGKKTAMPTWEEMSQVKQAFWSDEDVVVQFHPKKSEYVNHHPHVLHLWRPVGVDIPTPPPMMVGPTT